MVDHYTKIVLTLIAAALVALVSQNFIRPASAQFGQFGAQPCGGFSNPCYIQPNGPIGVYTILRRRR